VIELPSGVPQVREIPREAGHLQLEIPARISEVKTRGSATAARDWQLAVRQAFQSAFSAGYTVVGFSRSDPARPSYLLERGA
jgi:predicted GNAT superfamily acetyltransferase